MGSIHHCPLSNSKSDASLHALKPSQPQTSSDSDFPGWPNPQSPIAAQLLQFRLRKAYIAFKNTLYPGSWVV